MLQRVKSISKIKFGTLGMAGVMLFAGLGIATVVGNLPGGSNKAHATTWTDLGAVPITTIDNGIIHHTVVGAVGCKTLRNSAYGQVADVTIIYSRSANYSSFNAYMVGLRPGSPYPTTIASTNGSVWWLGQTLQLTVTVSVLMNDYVNGFVDATNGGPSYWTVFSNKSPLSMGNC